MTTKRHRLAWRQKILLTLISAISTFIISVIGPENALMGRTPVVVTAEKVGSQQVGMLQANNISSSNASQNGTSTTFFIAQPNEAFKNAIFGLDKQAQEQRMTFAVPKQFQGKTLEDVKISPKEKVIALTFDDGPWPEWTPQILDILKKDNIKATFFWVGKNLKSFPALGKQVVAEGHAIGNHTWHHWYHKMNAVAAAREIDDTAALIYKITGVKTFIFRPPGGFLNNGVADYAKKKNYLVAMWSADSSDYSRPSVDKLVKNVLKDVHSGGMVLMHDGGGDRSNTVKALPKIIDTLRAQGYKFVTVPELLDMESKQQVGVIAKQPKSASTKKS